MCWAGFRDILIAALGICESLALADVNLVIVKLMLETVRLNKLQDRVVIYESNGGDEIPINAFVAWDLVV